MCLCMCILMKVQLFAIAVDAATRKDVMGLTVMALILTVTVELT